MSNKSEAGFVRIKDRIPYHGKGTEELLGALRKTLSDPSNKFAQKIVLEVGVPHIYIEKLVPEVEAVDLPQTITLHDAIRTHKMEEYETEINSDRNTHPLQHLWHIFGMVHDEGLEVCAIVAGSKAVFQKWLGVRIHPTKMSILETPFSVVGELPEDVFIVCGAPARTAENDEIRYSVKGTM